MGIVACGAPEAGVTLTLVGDDGGALPPGTYVAALVIDGAHAQVAGTLAGTTPYADVALEDGRRLRVTAGAPTERQRSLSIAIVDIDGIPEDPSQLTVAPELWLAVPGE